jgi:C-terminal processing protease CtpA/Prc
MRDIFVLHEMVRILYSTMGDQGPNSLRFSPPAEGGEVREESNLVGVGIVFQPVEDGTLYVKRMREDSPAARSGLIQIGDCLCEVNGRCARPSVRPPTKCLALLALAPAAR